MKKIKEKNFPAISIKIFFIIGDIRDLVIEGSNYINDRDVDKIIVALSTLGRLSTASTYTHFEQLPQLKMQYQY